MDYPFGIQTQPEWVFIPIQSNNYIIQNKNKCYLKIDGINITCQNINIDMASRFQLIKIYEEVKHSLYDYHLIEKEPIDLVIKYIDLMDQTIHFKGMPEKRPEYDDEELKYCILSVLKNIPWVRKIFILTPNVNIKYFKERKTIRDKIIIIKDKNIYGSNNYNWLSFKFRYWKLKKYGLSDNFIAMDYNNFIGLPLNKDDFFYVYNETVIPAIITNKFIELKNLSSPNEIKNNLKKKCI